MRNNDEEQESMGAAQVTELQTPVAAPAGEQPIREAIAQGDHREAMLLCARRYGQAIGRLCMAMMGVQADAEDLAQETLLDAYAGFGGWRAEGTVRAWLMSIARRKCARQLEKRARRTAKLRLVHDADKAPEPCGAEEDVLLRQRANRARELLASVRPSEREALLLRFGAGLSFREVAAACGIEEPAARKRVSRAIATLRESLKEEGSKS